MKSKVFGLFLGLALVTYGGSALANPTIINIVETGGDNEATDTIAAKWTGTTFNVSVANEPVPGAVVGTPYSVGVFGQYSPAFVDRNHRYVNASYVNDGNLGAIPLPDYLVGGEYIMSGNDNRDNGSYRLDVTLAPEVQEAIVYMLIDNRTGETRPAPRQYAAARARPRVYAVDSRRGLDSVWNGHQPNERPIASGRSGDRRGRRSIDQSMVLSVCPNCRPRDFYAAASR